MHMYCLCTRLQLCSLHRSVQNSANNNSYAWSIVTGQMEADGLRLAGEERNSFDTGRVIKDVIEPCPHIVMLNNFTVVVLL